MAQVLLTVSGVVAPDIAEQIQAGKRPRADYVELARVCDADIIDYATARRAHSWFGRVLERIGGADLLLAWACFQRRDQYQVIFTDGEQIGIPLAGLLIGASLFTRRRVKHLMIVHILSVKKKALLFDLFRLHNHIDTFLVYATWQQRFIQNRWKLPSERVVFTPFMVDTEFFSLQQVQPNLLARPMICTAGLESRDYPTMLQAVRGLDMDVTIAAASPWAKQSDTTQNQEIPENVSVRRFSQYDLRQLYADSQFVVMPLYNVQYQAGVTALLEAMAMSRAVICTRTPGQTDVVVEGETGLYVPPGDPQALRRAIEFLLNNPAVAERMGQAGRRRMEEYMSLDHYVARLSRFVDEAISTDTRKVTSVIP